MSSEDSPAVYISAWLEEQAAVYQPCGYLSAYWNQTCSIRVQRLSKFSPLLIRQRFAGLAVACLSLMFTPVLTTMSVLCAKNTFPALLQRRAAKISHSYINQTIYPHSGSSTHLVVGFVPFLGFANVLRQCELFQTCHARPLHRTAADPFLTQYWKLPTVVQTACMPYLSLRFNK